MIELGDGLAEEVVAEEGLVLIRNGLNPETGGSPDCLEVVNGLFTTVSYSSPESVCFTKEEIDPYPTHCPECGQDTAFGCSAGRPARYGPTPLTKHLPRNPLWEGSSKS